MPRKDKWSYEERYAEFCEQLEAGATVEQIADDWGYTARSLNGSKYAVRYRKEHGIGSGHIDGGLYLGNEEQYNFWKKEKLRILRELGSYEKWDVDEAQPLVKELRNAYKMISKYSTRKSGVGDE
ncbi:hypothetical protein WOSG25_290100 [Weissella oryzae SG25]|uniref:Uncharacterized protein n=1 Tax=Weissella oryzae (strain DSM 25784 / JCM 18191 / LMG 30913 / SG25) TaxID=1329250 RepID=A0A069D3T7_WEIOS|nr:hypothetical protein [Weissella oryzae]GAK32076.1 hypothetical protein WOSG25_290100 [Weissella oryzae SG25]